MFWRIPLLLELLRIGTSILLKTNEFTRSHKSGPSLQQHHASIQRKDAKGLFWWVFFCRKSKAFVETRLALRHGYQEHFRPVKINFLCLFHMWRGDSRSSQGSSSLPAGQEHYQGQLQELKKTMVGDVQRLQDCSCACCMQVQSLAQSCLNLTLKTEGCTCLCRFLGMIAICLAGWSQAALCSAKGRESTHSSQGGDYQISFPMLCRQPDIVAFFTKLQVCNSR